MFIIIHAWLDTILHKHSTNINKCSLMQVRQVALFFYLMKAFILSITMIMRAWLASSLGIWPDKAAMNRLSSNSREKRAQISSTSSLSAVFKFVDDFRPAVQDGDHVLDIMTQQIVASASAIKGFQFGT